MLRLARQECVRVALQVLGGQADKRWAVDDCITTTKTLVACGSDVDLDLRNTGRLASEAKGEGDIMQKAGSWSLGILKVSMACDDG